MPHLSRRLTTPPPSHRRSLSPRYTRLRLLLALGGFTAPKNVINAFWLVTHHETRSLILYKLPQGNKTTSLRIRQRTVKANTLSAVILKNMEENKNGRDEKVPAEIKTKFTTWFENFWYHYKWHSIIALFLVFTIVICSVQMCQKESYDVYVLYAGNHEIERQSTDGDFPEYKYSTLSFNRVAEDYNEDGKTQISLKDLFVLSSLEIEQIEKSDEDIEVNYSLLNENKNILKETMIYSDYYVCFLSKAVYEEYKTVDGVEMFAKLAPYVNSGTNVEYYTDSAIYLSSTAFYSLPGIWNLPADTVICLKNQSAFSTHFNKKGAKKAYENSKDMIANILNYGTNN